jgi:DNA-binding IclR family transcriptional regulator
VGHTLRIPGNQAAPVYGVRAVARTVAILRAFCSPNTGLGVSDLAKRVSLHKSTTHRILTTLEQEGFVTQDPTTGCYRLGLALLELGSVVMDGLDVRRMARPFLEAIHRACGETVHLAILDEGEVVYIDKIEGTRGVRMYSQIGKRSPAYCTGLGKALLAWQRDDEISLVIKRGLRAYTLRTITSPSALRGQLALVRAQGYAIDHGEHEELIQCVAAPVWDRAGRVAAAISIATVAADITSGEFRKYIPLVCEHAQLISEALGGRATIAASGRVR